MREVEEVDKHQAPTRPHRKRRGFIQRWLRRWLYDLVSEQDELAHWMPELPATESLPVAQDSEPITQELSIAALLKTYGKLGERTVDTYNRLKKVGLVK